MELDKRSRHLHSIAWDPYGNWLIATLGDGCPARVIYSEDFGQSWKPLYKGAWQFIPIVVCEDMAIFGMDSSIVKGGVGILHPEDYRWEFKFFRWLNGRVSLAQICYMKPLNNSLWIVAFGTPQAIAISKDLHTWYLVYVEGYNRSFNFHMSIDETDNTILCSTGDHLIAFNKENYIG
ncbi:MAG: hypothetical protein QXR45_13770 [Candidatus Bathyarchaeia archaeon]